MKVEFCGPLELYEPRNHRVCASCAKFLAAQEPARLVSTYFGISESVVRRMRDAQTRYEQACVYSTAAGSDTRMALQRRFDAADAARVVFEDWLAQVAVRAQHPHDI